MSNYNINDCDGLGIPGLGNSPNQAACKPLIFFLDSGTIEVSGTGAVCDPLLLEVKPTAFEQTPISASPANFTLYSNDRLGGEGSAAGQNLGYSYGSLLFGYQAANNSNNVSMSVVAGYEAGKDTTSMNSSVLLGGWAGMSSIYFSNVVAIGNFAGASITDTNISSAIFIGDGAGANIGGFNNSNIVAIGNSAGQNLNVGTYGNYGSTFLGSNAGYNAKDLYTGIAIGAYAASDSDTNPDLVAIGTSAAGNAVSTSNLIAIGAYAGNNDSFEDMNELDDWGVLIGYKTNLGGFKNSVVLGGGNSENANVATMDNQVKFADSLQSFSIRGVNYSMPGTGSAGVLVNDGDNNLEWGAGYPAPYLNQYYIPFTGADGKLTDTIAAGEAGLLVWADGVQAVSNNSYPFIGVKNSISYNGIFRAVTTASGSSAKATIEFAKTSVPYYQVGLDNTSFVIRDSVNNINRLTLNQTGNIELQGDGDLVINRTTQGLLKGLRFNESGGGERGFLKLNASTGEFRLGTTAGGYFQTFYSNGSERARIDTSGNLLLGTTTATGKLSITGTGTTGSTANIDVVNSAGTNVFRVRDDSTLLLGSGITNAQLIINSTNSTAGVFSPAYSSGSANIINYKNFSGVSRMTLDMTGSLGLLGINTTVPTHPLTLSSTAMVGGNGIALYSTTDQTTNYQRLRLSLSSGNIASYALENAGVGTAVGYHQFMLNGSAVLQVDAQQALFGGNLLTTNTAGDNTKDIGRLSASPFRFRSMYLGTSAQIGAPANTTIGARMHLGASTTTLPQILLETGVAPTAPADGAVWFDGSKLYMRIGGVTKEFVMA
ncbi:MAG: hypothetical protein ACTHMM_21145 [Agriterribacter sp.]